MFAHYTVVLKDLMDNPQSMELLNTALFTYPLYEQKSKIETIIPERSELNKRLLNHYKYREIGFETVGRFIDELEITMCEIMPYYNEMYKTVEIMAGLENPFDNVDFTETYEETRTGTEKTAAQRSLNDEGSSSATNKSKNTTNSKDSSETNSNVENISKNVHSGTPQNELSIPAKNIDSVPFADDVTWNKSENNDSAETSGESESTSNTDSTQTATSQNLSEMDESGERTSNDTVEHTFKKKGNQGVNTYAHDMIEFRTSIIDITNKIINDDRISELFMRVF